MHSLNPPAICIHLVLRRMWMVTTAPRPSAGGWEGDDPPGPPDEGASIRLYPFPNRSTHVLFSARSAKNDMCLPSWQPRKPARTTSHRYRIRAPRRRHSHGPRPRLSDGADVGTSRARRAGRGGSMGRRADSAPESSGGGGWCLPTYLTLPSSHRSSHRWENSPRRPFTLRIYKKSGCPI